MNPKRRHPKAVKAWAVVAPHGGIHCIKLDESLAKLEVNYLTGYTHPPHLVPGHFVPARKRRPGKAGKR